MNTDILYLINDDTWLSHNYNTWLFSRCEYIMMMLFSFNSSYQAPAEGSSSVPLAALPADYHSVQVERELVGKVKTEISVASKAIGALHAASAANRNVTKEEDEVKAALSQLDKLVTEYKEKQTEDSTDVVVRVVGQMVAMCATVPASKEEYGEFVLSVQRLTGQLFKEQGRLLQEMKDIKKAATTNVEAPAAS